jgi:hypothetical protein
MLCNASEIVFAFSGLSGKTNKSIRLIIRVYFFPLPMKLYAITFLSLCGKICPLIKVAELTG